jgi:hypothetical protein
MSDLWFNNINVLFTNMNVFFPTNDLSRNEKINALARFAIYYGILILLMGLDNKWLSVSVVLLVMSIYLGYYENFKNIEKKTGCVEPSENNPFMNFTLDDYMNNTNRNKACPYENVKQKMRRDFKKNLVLDPADLWGQNISDRNFYTMPSTQIVNEQTKLGQWLYGKAGQCKTLGLNCAKDMDNRYSQSRYYLQY